MEAGRVELPLKHELQLCVVSDLGTGRSVGKVLEVVYGLALKSLVAFVTPSRRPEFLSSELTEGDSQFIALSQRLSELIWRYLLPHLRVIDEEPYKR